VLLLRVNADIYAFADEKKIIEIIECNRELKDFIDEEMDRMTDEGIIKKYGGCHHHSGNCNCGGCCKKGADTPDAAYLTTAMISIFNYYIPDNIKNAINLGGSAFIEEIV